MKYVILWHGKVLREFEDEERAISSWKFFNGFLLPNKLDFIKEY